MTYTRRPNAQVVVRTGKSTHNACTYTTEVKLHMRRSSVFVRARLLGRVYFSGRPTAAGSVECLSQTATASALSLSSSLLSLSAFLFVCYRCELLRFVAPTETSFETSVGVLKCKETAPPSTSSE